MPATLLATIPQADPLPVPGPPTLIWLLLLLTFLLHLLPMNFVLGGSIIAVNSWRRASADRRHRDLARFLGAAMPPAIAATVTFGVAPLLLTQVLYGRLFFSSSILMAWFWAAVVPLLMLAYYGAYIISFRQEKLGARTGLVAALISLILVVIAFIYSNNMSLMLRAGEFAGKYAENAHGWQLNLDDPSLWPRYLHMLLGAIAVSGMVVSLWGLRRWNDDEQLGRWAVRHGALWFSVLTGLNLVTGFWWLMALPRETMLRFMGRNMLATIGLTLGIVFGISTLMMMVLAINSTRPRGLVRGSAMSLLLTLVLMIVARDQVRQGALEAAGYQLNPWIEPQWGPLLIFIVLLLAGLATVVWMIRKLAAGSSAS